MKLTLIIIFLVKYNINSFPLVTIIYLLLLIVHITRRVAGATHSKNNINMSNPSYLFSLLMWNVFVLRTKIILFQSLKLFLIIVLCCNIMRFWVSMCFVLNDRYIILPIYACCHDYYSYF